MNALATYHDAPDMTDTTIDDRWARISIRDRSADGCFVYAVTSTGVFCRPSCPSRRPRRDRVRFFDSSDAAQQAGFRACLRCRPLEGASDPWVARIARACQDIARAATPPPLATLARGAGSSPYHFLRHFKRIVGVTPRAFADARRVEEVKRHLRTEGSVTSAMYEAGYESSSRFYEGAASRLAMTPSAYRAGGAGETIRYATAASGIGRVLIAATDRGVCRVALGDDDGALLVLLREEYPKAQLEKGPAALRATLVQVTEHLAGTRPRLDLPLDVRATAFQRQVWEALKAIPRGETRTYGEVAQAIGRPSASRAVARACASNPVALVVPCHRVVPAAGGTGGYRWGRERKQRLLARERS
jgi:AraC family transcriptional regulator of adaptative response/methylated-DNA-[protein]-cysteine methyltransferase